MTGQLVDTIRPLHFDHGAERSHSRSASRRRCRLAHLGRIVAAWLMVTTGLTAITIVGVGLRPAAAAEGGWNGGVLTTLPTPSGQVDETLAGVSCTTDTACVAVGNDGGPVAQTLSGSAWTATSLPIPSNGYLPQMTGVSCAAATACIAVGYIDASSTTYTPIAEVLSGTTWTVINLPLPSGWTSGQLKGISCTAAVACHAVGYGEGSTAFADTLSGSTWTAVALPWPFGTDAGIADLQAISCAAATACVAVGAATDNTIGVTYAFAETLSGSTWTVTDLPYRGGTNGDVTGVSCTASTVCVAVGYAYSNNSASYTPFTEVLSGATWTATNPPLPTGWTSATLSGVSCSAATACVAVGLSGSETGGTNTGFAETLSGSTWVATILPQPSGLTDASAGSISCISAIACVGAGEYWDATGTSQVPIAYVSPSPEGVTPDGTAPGADTWGGGGGASASCNCATGEPIDPATGDFYNTTTDLTIPSAGIPLTFTRTYDAKAAQAEATGAVPAGPLGYGWTDNLGMSVAYNSGTGLATVTQTNGSQLTFQYYAMGATEPVGSNGVTWCPSDATAGVFCPTAPRYIATLSGASGGTGGPWTFVNDIKSPITYSFTSGGVLSQIADAAGDTLVSSAYSPGSGQAACPSGDTCIAWSSTPGGESTPTVVLVEAFNASSQLVSVFDAASAASSTQVATFTYSGTGCSTWTGTPQDLCSVTDPGSLTTTFAYDTGKSSPYQYDETTMSPPATGQVANTYDGSGRITRQVITTGATNQELDFAYAANSTVTNGTQTTVTAHPNGAGGTSITTTYLYSNGVEVEMTNGTSATTYVNRDPATLLGLNTIDGNGNETSHVFSNYAAPGGTPTSSADTTLTTDAMGNVSQTLYTSANLPYCAMNAADYAWGQAQGTPVSCPTTPPTTPPTGATGYTINIYNAANQVTSTTDPLGKTTANAYTIAGSGVPVGLLYCTVDPVDYKASVTCPAYGAAHVMGTATKTFDAAGDVLTSTDADGNTSSFNYGSAANPGLPTVITDPDGKVTTDTYNAEGEILTQVVTGTTGTYSATTQYAYDSAGRKFCEVGPYEYSNSIRCPSTPPTSPPTGTPGYTDTIYNSNGQVTSTTSPIGGTTQYAYDGSGNKYCTVSPTNYASGTRCPTALPLTTPTPGSDPYLGTTITTFDADNRATQVTNPLGGITLTSYDAADNATQTSVESNNTTSAPNVVTATTYDADNRAISTTVGSGSSSPATTLTNYDPNSNAFCTVSATAYKAGTSAYQCPLWQPGWIVIPPSPTALYSTTPTASQANNVSTAFFNADGVAVQSTNPDVQTSISVTDADGRTYCTSDPVNVSAWLTANPSGIYPYLCPSTPPTSAPTTTTGYVTTILDHAGRTLSSTDQVGNTTAYTYDPSGHTTTVTDPRGQVTTSCYYRQSGIGQCAAGAPAAGGSLDDLYSQTTPATTADPSGATTTYTYFPGDTAHVTSAPSGTTTDSYDASLDLTGVAYSGTASGYSTPSNLSYTYFADGSRHNMVDASGTTTYTDDANGDVTNQQFAAGGGTGLANNTVAYGYFTTGVRSSVTYPTYGSHASPQATYTYDALGKMTSVTDWLSNKVTFAHDGDGNLTAQDNAVSTSNPNGTSNTAFSYDNADLNTQGSSTLNCSGTNGTLTQSFSGGGGSRNADGQVTQDSESYSGSCAGPVTYERNYNYDQAGRVVYQGTAPQGANPNNVIYDGSGDPTQISSHDGSGNFDSYSQAFDNAGETQSQTPISGSMGASSTYSYDTLGDRTTTVTGSATTNYGYDQAGHMTSTTPNSTTYLYDGNGLEAASKFSTPSWGSPSSIDGTKTINSVSCPSSTFCEAVDGSGNALSYNGTSWSTATSIDGTKSIKSVSCPTSSFCEAVDGSGNALSYNGTSWSSATLIDRHNVLDSVSCPTISFCEGVDNSGNALKYNGTSWSAASSIDGTKVINSVSCPTSSFCMAVDGSGNALNFNGTSWSTATSIDGTKSIKSVSCPTTSFCEAVDGSGNTLSYNGTTWSAVTNIDGAGVLYSVSCTSSTFCAATDGSGAALIYNGTSWSAAIDIDGTKTLEAVACVSATCVAVDNGGNAQRYQTRNATSQFIWNPAGSLSQALSDGSTYYIYGPTGEPIEQVNTTTTPPVNNPTFMTYTPSDSSWLLTNAAGNQANSYRYDAFGNLATGTPGSPFGYAGQYTDASTGLVNDRARFYDSQTGSFTTRDPAFSQTDQAYAYAGGDPVNATDPSGLCVEVLWVCVGGGQQTSSIGFHFDPGAGANAVVNIGRGASFGLSDTIANWISPGASCTVAQNGLDQAIGSAATIVASLGAGAEAASSQRIGDLAFKNRFLGADSSLFGNYSFGETTDASGLLNPPGRGVWRLGWSVDRQGSSTVPGFRLKAPLIGYKWLLHASGF
jgi:RHS repeat-associated protein